MYFNSQVYPALILKNYTYLAHKSGLVNLDLDKLEHFKELKQKLILFKKDSEFITYFKNFCSKIDQIESK